MLRTLALLLLFISIRGYAQTIGPARQIALNNYVEYAKPIGARSRFSFQQNRFLLPPADG